MQDLATRAKSFAVSVTKLSRTFPSNIEANMIRRQVLRSAASVGAHYREASRARSHNELVTKIDVGQAELEETAYWIELAEECELITTGAAAPILKEARELVAIPTAISNKVKRRKDEG